MTYTTKSKEFISLFNNIAEYTMENPDIKFDLYLLEDLETNSKYLNEVAEELLIILNKYSINLFTNKNTIPIVIDILEDVYWGFIIDFPTILYSFNKKLKRLEEEK